MKSDVFGERRTRLERTQTLPFETQPLNAQVLEPSKMAKEMFAPSPELTDERERKKEKLEPPPSHISKMNHAIYMKDLQFRQCYPLISRIANRAQLLLKCRNPAHTFVDELNEQDKHNMGAFMKNDKVIDVVNDKIVKIKIMNTSALEMDTNIMHPFVRVHVVELTTGRYVTKDNVEHNAVYNFETNCYVEEKDGGTKEHKSCEMEFIPPFATNCCDMRYTSNSRAVWNEEVIINIPGLDFCDPEILILFEILDFNVMYLNAKKVDSLDVDYNYRIAWGYLRPLGLSAFHLGNVRIQLYRYQFNTHLFPSCDRPETLPLVYFDFIWLNKMQYNGVLNILYLMTEKPKEKDVQTNPMNVFEIEMGDRGLTEKFAQHDKPEESEQDMQEELSDQDKINLRRRRFWGEKSQIPDCIAYKFASDQLGCYRLTFNRKGNFLAAACTSRSSKTVIKIFDVETADGKKFVQFRGHSNIIHSMEFSGNSAYLITCSSDQTAKIWRIPRNSQEQIMEEESDHHLMAQLAHPSFVYSGIFITDGAQALCVTACFDSRIRVWRVDSKMNMVVHQDPVQWEVISTTGNSFDHFEDILEHRHPNSLSFDGARRLYVGDSLGGITIYDINSNTSTQYIATRNNFILNPEMKGDAINSLSLIPLEMKDLLVHSRDNCIRIMEVNSSENKYSDGGISTGVIGARFFGSKSEKLCIRSVVSPCGEYILSGSEDGKPHLWDNIAIEQPTQQFQYDLQGPVVDVAWNYTYHMIALAGFGDEHPILVYTWERNEGMNIMEYKELQEKLITEHKQKHIKKEGIQQTQQQFF